MNRTNLLWFAAGAGASAIAALTANQLVTDPVTLIPHLSIFDRPLRADELDKQEDQIAFTGGEVFRECGAKDFQIKLVNGWHGEPESLIKIDKQNETAIHCILKRAAKEGFPIGIRMIMEPHAQTH